MKPFTTGCSYIRMLPARILKHLCNHAHDSQQTAAILFSSGSEVAERCHAQPSEHYGQPEADFGCGEHTQEQDVLMSCLPLFHAFGLTVNRFMPLIEGIPVVCHADPTDAVGVAKNVAQYRATILCGLTLTACMPNASESTSADDGRVCASWWPARRN